MYFLYLNLSKTINIGLAVLVIFSLLLPNITFAQEADSSETEHVFIHFTEDAPKGLKHGLITAFGGELTHSFNSFNGVAATIPTKAISGLERNPFVSLVEPDNQVEAVAITYDTEYTNAWGVDRIESGVAHETNNKGEGIKIGIIDSGINYNHPDLSPNYKGGYDFYYYDNDPMDVYGHGTHVAGTACASDNDNGFVNPKLGVVGVAPECDLYSLRVLGNNGSGYESDIMYAIEWALGDNIEIYWNNELQDIVTGERMDVVNLSLGSSNAYSQASEQTFLRAEQEGLIMVAAAGNSGNKGGNNNTVIYPAKYESLIAVAATDADDNRATFSSTGEEVEIAAPGVSVYSTWNDSSSPTNPQPTCESGEHNCYKYGSGTSMASPHVAGAVALLLKAGLSPTEIRSRLQTTAIDIGTIGKDVQFGYGLLNVANAVTGIGHVDNPPSIIITTPNNGTEVTGEVLITASSSDDNEVAEVRFYVDDTLIDIDTTIPYESIWDSTSVTDGTYNIIATAIDNIGQKTSDNTLIVVNNINDTPKADAGIDQSIPDPENDGEIVILDGSNSSDPDGTIVSYEWDVNGDGIVDVTGTRPEVMLPIGKHIIELTVTDNNGASATDNVTIDITEVVVSDDLVITSALGHKIKGEHIINLNWTGGVTAYVDIYRNGTLAETTLNDGTQVDHTNNKGKADYYYKICEAGSITTCSAPVDVTFN